MQKLSSLICYVSDATYYYSCLSLQHTHAFTRIKMGPLTLYPLKVGFPQNKNQLLPVPVPPGIHERNVCQNFLLLAAHCKNMLLPISVLI